MANIVLIKFVSGEEIIADLVTDADNNKVIKDAVTLVYRPQEGGSMTVGFAPFMPYSNGSITLYDTSILAFGEPQEDLKREFERIFGSGIVVAQANDSVFKV
jgi:hypothetical protein